MSVTINGINSSSLGLKVTERKLPLLSGVRQEKVRIVGKHGKYNFSDYTLEEKEIEITFVFVDKTSQSMKNKRKIAQWLYSQNELQIIFEDENDVYYLGTVANQIDLEQTMAFNQFTVQFACHPFAYSLNAESITFSIYGTSRTFSINNDAFEVAPLITISSASNLVLSMNGAILRLNGSHSNIVIDNENMTVRSNGSNIMRNASGQFLKLASGMNTLKVQASSMSGNLMLQYSKRYL